MTVEVLEVLGGFAPSSAGRDHDAQKGRRLLAPWDCRPECRGDRLLILLASREVHVECMSKATHRGGGPHSVTTTDTNTRSGSWSIHSRCGHDGQGVDRMNVTR